MRILKGGFLLALLAMVAALAVGVTSAAPPRQAWPTPPPGPSGPFPTVIPSTQLVPAPPPTRTGGVTAVVNPVYPGIVPRIPPLPTFTVLSAEPDPDQQVEVIIEAGTFPVTFQLKYEPADAGALPPVPASWRVLRAFHVEIYDYRGDLAQLVFARPLRLRIPALLDTLSAPDTGRSQLLLARFDEAAQRWVPLVTTIQRDGAIGARLLATGLFLLAMEEPPVPPP